MFVDAIATHARAKPGTTALVDLASNRRWAWRELNTVVNRVASWLVSQYGPKSGARIATLAKNCDWVIILQFACVRAGAIFVPLNWRLSSDELQKLVDDARPVVVVRDAAFLPLQQTADILIDTLIEIVATQPDLSPDANARHGWDHPSTLLYTSGTTGKPKGVTVSEANAFFGSVNFSGANRVTCDSVFLCDMPLFHTAGLFAASRTSIQAGATLLISDGFEPVKTLSRLSDPALGITHYFSVPQMAQAIWNLPGFDPTWLKHLEVYATGGAPNPKSQIERFVRAGVPMADGFGMSETCSNFAMPVDDRARLIEKAGSIGLPMLAVEMRLVDDDGRDVRCGEAGELWLRGPSVTRGYWNRPELSEAAFEDGWFKTGDVAYRDADDFVFIVDRKKDMFISGGENVYPAEVEAVLAELADVAETAVIGVTDNRWGEVGCAYIVPVHGRNLDEQRILAHCRDKLAGFKVPKHVVIVPSIPRTASGKVQKHLLRSTFERG